MKKTEKKISVGLFDKIMKEHFQNECVIQWHDVQVNVKRTLPLADMLGFVDDVAKSCFHETFGFMPEVMDFVIKSNILTSMQTSPCLTIWSTVIKWFTQPML